MKRQAATTFTTVYEAETIAHSAGGPATGGWNLWSNGYLEAIHQFVCSEAVVTVTARGESAGGQAPHMRVTVGGNVALDTFVSSTSYTEFSAPVTVAPGSHALRIEFDNDYYQPPSDRNLIVDKVEVSSSCDSLPTEGISAEVVVTNDWGTGYCANLEVQNTGSSPTSTWLVSLDTNGGEIYTSWNANFSAQSGPLTVTPVSWNGAIQRGETIASVGFCVNRNGSQGVAGVVTEPAVKGPRVVSVPASLAPELPTGTKVTCLGDGDIPAIDECQVLRWNGYTYWAYSYVDNRVAMAITAYDAAGNLVASQSRTGARYILADARRRARHDRRLCRPERGHHHRRVVRSEPLGSVQATANC